MKIKYITFTLENCDEIVIDGKYIGNIRCSEIHKEIARTANNSIDLFDSCDFFFIEINKNANGKKTPFDLKDMDSYNIFDRLISKDITHIKIVFYDENNKEYIHHGFYNIWDDKDEYVNSYQQSHIDKYGDLYLLISKDVKIQDYIGDDIDIPEALEYKENYWEMLS